HDNGVPFYACVPTSSIDWKIDDGMRDIPIEERDAAEVTHARGQDDAGRRVDVLVPPVGTRAANFAFDGTPARLVQGIVTEQGVFPATAEGLSALENRAHA